MGGPIGFACVDEVIPGQQEPTVRTLSLAELETEGDRYGETLACLTAPRKPFSGIPLDSPRIMGVINVTPDSFSDGGRFSCHNEAILHGRAMLDAGADILDIGGESTRPGAEPVSPADEIRRVEPVISALKESGAPISVDTRHPETMLAARRAGASVLNDVSALSHSPESARTASELEFAVILMHMQGGPETMQLHPSYVHAPCDVYAELAAAVARARAAGIPGDRILVDPGIGFGKSHQHNLDLLAWLPLFHGLGCGVAVGASRKSLIGRIDTGAPAERRLGGSVAMAVHAAAQGVHLIRVHDVDETRQALRVWNALRAL